MKSLITVAEVKKMADAGQKTLYLETGTIITPAARDTAGELGITLQPGPQPKKADQNCCQPEPTPLATNGHSPLGSGAGSLPGSIDPALIARIVGEVIASLTQGKDKTGLVVEQHSGGLRLVKGSSVTYERFDTGNPGDGVGIREVITSAASPHMAAGFMTMERTAFAWNLQYEEIDYVIEGTLDIIIDGQTYRGTAGDVFYLPQGSRIIFSSPDKAKFFYVTYPANWAELSKK